MQRAEIRKLKGASSYLAGYTLGEAHRDEIIASLGQRRELFDPDAEGLVLALDFKGVEAATASYVKATFLHLLLRGRASARREDGGLNIFPLVANATPELVAEIDEVMRANDSQALLLARADDGGIASARVLGRLDPALRSTLESVCAGAETTAAELHEQSDKSVNPTAYNNRLADLLARRLVRRRRIGRRLVYLALAKEVSFG